MAASRVERRAGSKAHQQVDWMAVLWAVSSAVWKAERSVSPKVAQMAVRLVAQRAATMVATKAG